MELAGRADATTGKEQVRLKERLNEVMEDAGVSEHKAAGVRRPWSVRVRTWR